MTKLEQALAKLAELPPEDQEVIAEMILEYETAHEDDHQLSEEQLAEIQRRLADPDAKTISLEEFLDRTKSMIK